MGRLLDLTVLLTAILMFMILQSVGAAMLDPMRTELIDAGISSEYNAEANFADDFAVVTLWGPLTGLIGLTVLVAYREYRRQKITGLRRV